ncbi:pimeloyl-[acyl-carrier protein] methyl ester esterase [Veronia nyctiphanis]|uniref:Pimeloyl-[acyl-carrier protein] methyl ester esterase n=1 Tax=Veronia nyctiphanis TaxID=1278244 RepID=A0A4Q0YR19_9GAMM|nr:pimeloyl-ACP methyl ester esterase BioH [Veronia nyctiphanis]RXJ73045.1 pimeloyl-[acyl-carrier protein] methyl ester esterase [Veronia nyctiphanis]
MTKKLHWHSEGEGLDLILIHGWGMNAAVWEQVMPRLKDQFRIHTVDLPGFGLSHQAGTYSLEEMAQLLLRESPDDAIWLGWSLGGLVATQAALINPNKMKGLVTVASSPCFAEQDGWRGIKPAVLEAFSAQLENDFKVTIERFMALQAMGSPTARQDIKWLKDAVLSRPLPDKAALSQGLDILGQADLRSQLRLLSVPMLRMYGRLDGLVPIKVADDVSALAPTSTQTVFAKASHAPFISEPASFVESLKTFCGQFLPMH